MKKVLCIGALALTGVLSAQESYKPQAGDVSTEFGIKGGIFGNTTVELPNGDAFFKARYFKKGDLAYRVSFSLMNEKQTQKVDSKANEGTSMELHTTGSNSTSSTGFVLGFGVEKHFAGTSKLSPYIGGEVLVRYDSSKATSEKTTVNSGDNKTDFKSTFNSESKGPGRLSFGLRGVVGADYYFTKNVFIGLEAGLGFFYTSIGDTTVSTSNSVTVGGTTTPDSSEVVTPGGSTFNINPEVVTGVRVGFTF